MFSKDFIAINVQGPNDSLPARGKQALPIRRIRQREDWPGVTPNDPDHAANGRLPNPHGTIIAPGGALHGSTGLFRPESECVNGFGVVIKRPD